MKATLISTETPTLKTEPTISEHLPHGAELLSVCVTNQSHLLVVLAKFQDQYVTWLHNVTCGGMYYGLYKKTLSEGLNAFIDRVKMYSN